MRLLATLVLSLLCVYSSASFSATNDQSLHLDWINIKNLAELQQEIIHLQMIGIDTLFDFDEMQDFKNSQTVIGVASQGGLSLPDRDYYLKKDKKFQQIRDAYLLHIKNMFVLLGDD